LARLPRDPVAWAAYLAEAEATMVGDGVELWPTGLGPLRSQILDR
jgi:hypothetical protein